VAISHYPSLIHTITTMTTIYCSCTDRAYNSGPRSILGGVGLHHVDGLGTIDDFNVNWYNSDKTRLNSPQGKQLYMCRSVSLRQG
jgi:hypothetical protein